MEVDVPINQLLAGQKTRIENTVVMEQVPWRMLPELTDRGPELRKSKKFHSIELNRLKLKSLNGQ